MDEGQGLGFFDKAWNISDRLQDKMWMHEEVQGEIIRLNKELREGCRRARAFVDKMLQTGFKDEDIEFLENACRKTSLDNAAFVIAIRASHLWASQASFGCNELLKAFRLVATASRFEDDVGKGVMLGLAAVYMESAWRHFDAATRGGVE